MLEETTCGNLDERLLSLGSVELVIAQVVRIFINDLRRRWWRLLLNDIDNA
jgi:hypothetical protein